ncbi:MAG: discoidin domain-containing protein, partial [Lentisphaeria bacterium]
MQRNIFHLFRRGFAVLLNLQYGLSAKLPIVLLIFCLHLLPAQTLPADDQVLWNCDFSSFDTNTWNWLRCQPELVNGTVRIQVVPGAQGNYASFQTVVPAAPEDSFLQIQMGEMENVSAKPWVGNVSKDGVLFGYLFPGWNTFSMAQNVGRPFMLALAQLGGGKEAGPWVDYRLARIVRKATYGLVVSCPEKSATAPLQVGDELLFEYHAASQLAEEALEIHCFLHPQMLEYRCNTDKTIRLNDRGEDGDRVAGDRIYSARSKITADAFHCSADSKFRLMAAVKVYGAHSYYTIPNPLEIITENPIPKSLINAGNLQTQQDRQRWFDLAKGTNIALGKPVQLVPKPDYHLTSDDNDTLDLTDGQLSTRKDDKIWFDRQAVGWYFGNGEAFLKLDLGQLEKVDRLLIRCLGGTLGNFQFPRSFEVYVSRDGQLFHLARIMQKLMPGESAQSDFLNYYYLEEQGNVYATRMYPFQLLVQAEARYVLLKIIGTSGSIFCDEMALFKAEQPDPEFNDAYHNPGQEIPLEGLLVRPRLTTLDIIRNIPAPQSFQILDLRKAPPENETLTMVLDLPPGVSVQSPELPQSPLTLPDGNYLRYEIPIKNSNRKLSLPQIFLSVSEDCTGTLPAYCMARCGEQDQYRTQLPLRLVRLPEIPRFKRIHVSLSWMALGQAMAWPNFLENWEKLGFNTVSTFPRWWNPANYQDKKDFVTAAKKHGYRIIMNDSAFHEMMRGHQEGSEIFCDIPGKNHKMLCPSYRGSFYQKEMERVERCVRMGRPDYVFYDIECWGKINQSAAQCRRCQEALKKSGKSLDDFLLDCLTEHMRDLDAAVQRGAASCNIPVPQQGDYNRHPLGNGKYFSMIYPQYINMAMPSLYVAGRAVDVHRKIRGNYKRLGTRRQIPWLSTGTYGEFEPEKVEAMVLESLLNGADGITYYCYGDFTDSPLDFFYHARALSMLRPYENLIMDGKVLEPAGTNQELFYSAIQ